MISWSIFYVNEKNECMWPKTNCYAKPFLLNAIIVAPHPAERRKAETNRSGLYRVFSSEIKVVCLEDG
jgi:hypothetical protein